MNDPNPTIIDCLVLPALAMPLVIAACRFGAWLWRLAGFIDRLLARRPPRRPRRPQSPQQGRMNP